MNTTGNQLRSDHGDLLDCSSRLVSRLEHFRETLVSRDTTYEQHLTFAERAASLAVYLQAAGIAIRAHLYTPAYGILRCCLEHSVIDTLVFLGRRYSRVARNVDDKTWAEWQGERASGAEWTEDIISWQRTKTNVTIVRSGLHAAGEKRGSRAKALSLYYFLLRDFDPFIGKPGNQPYITSGFMEPDVYLTLAQRNQQMYRYAVQWSALKDNLRINRLYTLRSATHLDVHYSFLSAFVHPSFAGYELVWGHSMPANAPRYDRFSAELCLLYSIAIARAELRALERMSKRAPRVGLRDWSAVQADLVKAEHLTAHLWFPPDGVAHAYDRYVEANRRSAAARRKKSRAVIVPEDLPNGSIRYYRNPLRRLREMYRSATELTTGLSYVSPWERTS